MNPRDCRLKSLALLVSAGALAAGCSQAESILLNEDPGDHRQELILLHPGYAPQQVRERANEAIELVANNGGSVDVEVVTSASRSSNRQIAFDANALEGDFEHNGVNPAAREEERALHIEAAISQLGDQLDSLESSEGADLLGSLQDAIKTAATYERQPAVRVIVGGGAHRTSDFDIFVDHDDGAIQAVVAKELHSLGDLTGMTVTVTGIGDFSGTSQPVARDTLDQIELLWSEACRIVEAAGAACSES